MNHVLGSLIAVTNAKVNPTLTIIANALRVGDHLLERLGAGAVRSLVGQTVGPISSRTVERAFVANACHDCLTRLD